MKPSSAQNHTINTFRYFPLKYAGWLTVLLILCGCSSHSVAAGAPSSTLPVTEMPVKSTISPSKTPTLPGLVTKATPQPTKTICDDTEGKIIDTEVPNKILSYPLKVKIYFPPCYSDNPKTPYPFVVMIHGMLYTYDQWDRLGADQAANELISSGEAPPFLILLPYEEQTTANPFEDGFGNAITDSLLPWMEENYPVCKDRTCRAIGGLSRGAGWAIHIGLSSPQFFGAIGAHSLPPFIGDLALAPRWLAKIPHDEMPRVYIDIGLVDNGMVPATQFEHILTAYDVPHEWHINNGEHTEDYWSSHVKDYLRWYSEGWKQIEPPVLLN